MSWRMKQFLQKWTPIAVIASVLWVGYTHWQRGGRANVGSLVTSARIAAIRVPVLGSYFRSSRGQKYYRSGKHYAYGKASKRRGHKRRGRRR